MIYKVGIIRTWLYHVQRSEIAAVSRERVKHQSVWRRGDWQHKGVAHSDLFLYSKNMYVKIIIHIMVVVIPHLPVDGIMSISGLIRMLMAI